MRAVDVILGIGAVGVAVIAARAIANAFSDAKESTTVVLPPPQSKVEQMLASVQPTISPILEQNPDTPAPRAFTVVQDCTGELATTQACWCWGGGKGRPECADFDYTVFFDGQSIQ
jgi:hypothetical protein